MARLELCVGFVPIFGGVKSVEEVLWRSVCSSLLRPIDFLSYNSHTCSLYG